MTADDNRPRRRAAKRMSQQDIELWREVTRSLRPLRRKIRPEPVLTAQAAQPLPEGPQSENALPPEGAPPVSSRPTKPARPAPLAPIDRRFRQRLSRGIEPIEARLDLHGMRQNEAHLALLRFLRRAQAEGLRNVLVITGKGGLTANADPMSDRGVLRRNVPAWLSLPELRNVVLGFEAAHTTHGGDGALYVRLRRPDRRAGTH